MDESRKEQIRGMAADARHDSVTIDLLVGDIVTPKETNLANEEGSDTESERLESYLTDEQPHFIFVSRRDPPTISGPEAPASPESPKLNKVAHIVTDQQWLMLGGHDGDEQRLSVPLSAIERTNYEMATQGLTREQSSATSRIVLETAGAYFDIPVSAHYDQEDFVDLETYLRDAADSLPRSAALNPTDAGFGANERRREDVDRAALATLLDDVPEQAVREADRLVASADDADALVRDLAALRDDYETDWSRDSVDTLLESAESVAELRAELQAPNEEKREVARPSTD